EYIRVNISNPTWVAAKVTVYWKAGFNPYSYFGNPNSGISFYSTGERKLFILGGIAGNVKTADTDHFDDTIVIHEYGHFLEDVYAKQDSPGGSHDGDFIIDPRLAWSEGWANFFQSAVITNWDNNTNTYVANANTTRGKYYLDTVGFSSDPGESGESGYTYIAFNLAESGRTATVDRVMASGEGTFREISVSRTLYKTVSDTTAAPVYGASIPFLAIWTVFTSTVNGFRNPSLYLRNIGLFNYYLNSEINTNHAAKVAGWNSIVSNEYQNLTTTDYSDSVSWSAVCAKYDKSLTPVPDSTPSTSAYPRSEKQKSNDFYLYYYDGSSTEKLELTYSQLVGGKTVDLDLVVYQMDHDYYEQYAENAGAQASDYGVVGRSARTYPTIESGYETLNFTGKPAGYYLINVKAYTYGKLAATFGGTAGYKLELTRNSTKRYLCPQN
ncbi:MAG: hypothetical protein V4736_01850, partial [Bdellovibrionota bacterium]